MSKILLKTLTSVHIGSGNKLMNNFDFILSKDNDNNSYINVLDKGKMFDRFGDKNIESWVKMIGEGKTFQEIKQTFAPNTKADEYSKYKIELYDEVRKNDTLLEIIRDCKGRPYIPGSSIKGAIRTAILSTIASSKTEIAQKDYRKFEDKVFGSSPNSNVFRFFLVSDSVMPGNESVIAVRLFSMNFRIGEESVIDDKRSQLEEVIREGELSYFNLKIDEERYKIVKNKWNAAEKNLELGVLDDSFATVSNLFKLINAYTIRMLEREQEIWGKVSEAKADVDDYLDNIMSILNDAKECNENECILRIGHGSGWRFTTGAWTEDLNCLDDVRHAVYRKKYDHYANYKIFPKTRRVDCYHEQPLGFVKLSIVK